MSRGKDDRVGVDALSRGDTTKGGMQGNSLLTYFSFRLGAVQRSDSLEQWINSWWTGETPLAHLTVDGWFDEVFT